MKLYLSYRRFKVGVLGCQGDELCTFNAFILWRWWISAVLTRWGTCRSTCVQHVWIALHCYKLQVMARKESMHGHSVHRTLGRSVMLFIAASLCRRGTKPRCLGRLWYRPLTVRIWHEIPFVPVPALATSVLCRPPVPSALFFRVQR